MCSFAKSLCQPQVSISWTKSKEFGSFLSPSRVRQNVIQSQGVWWALVWRIVTLGSVHVRGWAAVGIPEEATFCRTDAGILHEMNVFTSVHPPVHQPILCVPFNPKRQGGGNPVRDGPPSPQLNLFVWLLWQRDQSVDVCSDWSILWTPLCRAEFVERPLAEEIEGD